MSNEIAKTTQEPKTLRGLLESDGFKQQVARALPVHLTADRFIRIAATTMMRTPKLASCDQASFFNALLTLSQLGLEPDGRRAYLIPFENRKRGCVECQLIVSYQGLVELAMRSGKVSNIHCDVVCDNDVFEYDLGEIKQHKIDFKSPRGAMFAAYALIRFKDGTAKAEVMSKDDVDAIRRRSRAGDSGPWVSDYNEMAKKTVFRRASKWLELSPDVHDALYADDDVRPNTPSPAPIKRAVVTTGLDIPADDFPSSESPEGAKDSDSAPVVEVVTPVYPKLEAMSKDNPISFKRMLKNAGVDIGLDWHLADPNTLARLEAVNG